MRAFREYWTFSAIRGALTIVAAFLILAAPQGVVSVMGLARPVGMAIACLATYCVIDAVYLIVLATQLPRYASQRWTLYVRAVAGVMFSGLFYSQVGHPDGVILTGLLAEFAICAAFFEATIALDTYREYRSALLCFGSAGLMAGCAVAAPFARGLDAAGMSWALSGVIGMYGMSQLTVGGMMLFREYRSTHPAAAASEAWKAAMTTAPAAVRDDVESQIALVWERQHPAVARAMKTKHAIGGA